MFFAHFDIDNPKSVHDLFNLINIDLNNFFEFLSMLKGIKNAYLGHNAFQTEKMYTLILFIKNLSQDDFIYVPELKFIGNKNNTLKILNSNSLENVLKKSTYEDEVILGKLLSYPCPGLDYTQYNKKPIPIQYILITNKRFRELFHTDKERIQISGSACSKEELTDKVKEKINFYGILLNDYIESLSFGRIFLKIGL